MFLITPKSTSSLKIHMHFIISHQCLEHKVAKTSTRRECKHSRPSPSSQPPSYPSQRSRGAASAPAQTLAGGSPTAAGRCPAVAGRPGQTVPRSPRRTDRRSGTRAVLGSGTSRCRVA